MRVSLYQPPHLPDLVVIRARAEGPGMLGDATWEIRPGEDFLGWTYEELKALGTSLQDLQPKPSPPSSFLQTGKRNKACLKRGAS